MGAVSMKIQVGDSISALGFTFEVAKIVYQDFYNGQWDVEFLDPHGGYHHWKSEFDGGKVIRRGAM
jgi:hypothetical protein